MSNIFFILVISALAAGNSLAAEGVSAPTMIVGDWWTFQNPTRGDISLSVTEVNDRGFTVMNKGKPSVYTPAFNKLSGQSGSTGEAVTYAPHNANFDWPLYPGKTWTQRVTSNTASKQVPYTVTGTVGDWEEIEVAINGQVRKLPVLKISYQHGSVSSTCWYSPEVKNVAKCVSPFPGQTFEIGGFGNKPPD